MMSVRVLVLSIARQIKAYLYCLALVGVLFWAIVSCAEALMRIIAVSSSGSNQPGQKKRGLIDSPLSIYILGGYNSSRPLRGCIFPHVINWNIEGFSQSFDYVSAWYIAFFFNPDNSSARYPRIFRQLLNVIGAAYAPVFQSQFQVFYFFLHSVFPSIASVDNLILMQKENKSNTFFWQNENSFQNPLQKF